MILDCSAAAILNGSTPLPDNVTASKNDAHQYQINPTHKKYQIPLTSAYKYGIISVYQNKRSFDLKGAIKNDIRILQDKHPKTEH